MATRNPTSVARTPVFTIPDNVAYTGVHHTGNVAYTVLTIRATLHIPVLTMRRNADV